MDDFYPKPLTFWEYQKKAKTTAIYPADAAIYYPALGLAGEAGETCGKISKLIRDMKFDNKIYIEHHYEENKDEPYSGKVTEVREALKGEIGDILWFISALCSDLDLTLEEVAQANLDKLQSRKERGVLGGSGDNR